MFNSLMGRVDIDHVDQLAHTAACAGDQAGHSRSPVAHEVTVAVCPDGGRMVRHGRASVLHVRPHDQERRAAKARTEQLRVINKNEGEK